MATIPEQIEDELTRTINRMFRPDIELGRQICELYMQNPLLNLLLKKAYDSLNDSLNESPYKQPVLKVIEGGKDAAHPKKSP